MGIHIGASPLLSVIGVLFDGVGYLLCQSSHFSGFHLDVVMEIEVGFGLHGDKVDVGVGHFKAQHGDTYFDTGTGFFKAGATRCAKRCSSQ